MARKTGNRVPDRPKRGPLGDVIPKPDDPAPTRGGQPQEKVEDRPVVGQVKPEDYPADDRARSRP